MTEILISAAVAFLIWFFLLRKKYRSLGLRMFMVFSMISLLMCYWFFQDIQAQKNMKKNGHFITARLLKKWTERSGKNSIMNLITVEFEFPKGHKNQISTSEYISDEEHQTIQVGQLIGVLYNSVNQQVYYSVSLDRYKKDLWIFYLLPAFFFTLGCILWYFLRNFKVGIHEDTGDEYLEKYGKIILDEKGNELARTAKRVNVISKIFQILK